VGGKRERDVSPRQGNGGVPARTLNLLNVLARAWNASISLFYFGPFVRRLSLPLLRNSILFTPGRVDRPARNPFSLIALSCPFVQIWWPSRYDLTMIQLSTANWNEAPTSWAFSRLAFHLVLVGAFPTLGTAGLLV